MSLDKIMGYSTDNNSLTIHSIQYFGLYITDVTNRQLYHVCIHTMFKSACMYNGYNHILRIFHGSSDLIQPEISSPERLFVFWVIITTTTLDADRRLRSIQTLQIRLFHLSFCIPHFIDLPSTPEYTFENMSDTRTE